MTLIKVILTSSSRMIMWSQMLKRKKQKTKKKRMMKNMMKIMSDIIDVLYYK